MLQRRTVCLGLALLLVGVVASPGRSAPPTAVVSGVTQVPQPEDTYRGWPTLTRTPDGDLLIAYSGHRQGHIGPFGRVELVRSHDGGETWSDPAVVFDSPTDDRDAGVVVSAKGTWIVTTFASNAWLASLSDAEAEWKANGNKPFTQWFTRPWDADRLAAWQRMRADLPERWKGATRGLVLRSEDHGATWSEPVEAPVNTPHGPIVLRDGRLLFVGRDAEGVRAAQSTDDGRTWRVIGTIPPRPGDQATGYFEASAVELTDGTIVVQLRNHNTHDQYIVLQSRSTDGGKTWSTPRSTGVWGYPTQLLVLHDGGLLMTYGHRREPLSILARLSTDGGGTWSEPVTIAKDIPRGDMGYPTTAQLPDGRLVTAWYQSGAQDRYDASIRVARWRLVSKK